ncbi:MAG: VTT domain-containing protein [Archangium sp.]|nr:VTT domain-containing protein [Archangium sp.]
MDALIELYHTLVGWLRDPGQAITWAGYPGMMLIIFLETGALVAFLPGDSLLVVAGTYAAAGKLNLLYLNLLLIPMAVIGDATSYFIGSRAGAALFNRPQSRFFKQEHLRAAAAFYEKHGGKAIVIARFMPIVRTFVPVVAGIAQMPYRRFALFNIAGGASWVLSMTVIGYFIGSLVPDIGKHIEKVIIVVVFLSILPGIIGWFRNRKGASAQAAA